MKLFHLVAINHHPAEIREEYPNEADKERVQAALMRRFETVFVYRTFQGKKDVPHVD